MNMKTEAINAVIKGVDRYQTYRAEGKELGVDDKMKESYDKIINALKDTYKTVSYTHLKHQHLNISIQVDNILDNIHILYNYM